MIVTRVCFAAFLLSAFLLSEKDETTSLLLVCFRLSIRGLTLSTHLWIVSVVSVFRRTANVCDDFGYMPRGSNDALRHGILYNVQ